MNFEELTSPEGVSWNSLCSPEIYDEGYVKLGGVKGVFSRSYLGFTQRIQDFDVRDDDIWVVSFPKTGTTWTQEMIWCIKNDLDFNAAAVDLNQRFPYFELRANWTPLLHAKILKSVNPDQNDEKTAFFLNSFDVIDANPSPRFIKSHLHWSLLPQKLRETSKTKIIYIARHPKDTCVSFYHHSCLLDGYSGSLDDFVRSFVTDNVFCSPYWTHLKEFWEIRHNPNILFLKYEDLKKDLPEVIRRTSEFLGVTLSEGQIDSLRKHLSFESMKNNPAVNYEGVVENLRKIHGRIHHTSFFRKGQSGTDELTPELHQLMDEWIAKNKIEGLYD